MNCVRIKARTNVFKFSTHIFYPHGDTAIASYSVILQVPLRSEIKQTVRKKIPLDCEFPLCFSSSYIIEDPKFISVKVVFFALAAIGSLVY